MGRALSLRRRSRDLLVGYCFPQKKLGHATQFGLLLGHVPSSFAAFGIYGIYGPSIASS
jgi:hypothetical protein